MGQLAQQATCKLVELPSISHQKLNYYKIQKLRFYQLMRKFQLQKIYPLAFLSAPFFHNENWGRRRSKKGIGKRKEEEDKKNIKKNRRCLCI